MSQNNTRNNDSIVKHNPYRDLNWENVTQCTAQFHLHEPRNPIDSASSKHDPPAEATAEDLEGYSSPGELIDKYRNAGYGALAVTEHEYYVDGTKHKGEPFFEGLDVTTWPWSKWDRTGANDPIPIQGAELRCSVEGIDGLHDLVSLGNDLGHGREQSIEEVTNKIENRDGIAFLAHPGKYVDPEDADVYLGPFEQSDALLGLEVFNARDRYPGRGLWDALLTTLGSRRPIWAFADDDYHAKQRPEGAERFDRSRTVLLLEQKSPSAVIEALRAGQSYVQYDDDGEAPVINSIEEESASLTLAVPEDVAVQWISDGETIATGKDLSLTSVSGKYVRAEVYGSGEAVSCTQPIYLTHED